MNTPSPDQFEPQSRTQKLSALLSGIETEGFPEHGTMSQQWLDFFRTHYGCESGCSAPASRYLELLRAFSRSFACENVSVIRAPGRVNIIGEHTDYNAGPVLPMAIDRDVVAAYSATNDGVVRIVNLDEAYTPREFRVASKIEPFAQGDWGNYVKAAIEKLVQAFGTAGEAGLGRESDEASGAGAEAPGAAALGAVAPGAETTGGFGFEAVIHSTIPPAAGLSSSSALVVLAGAMYLAVNGIRVGGARFAELMAEAEHFVGTRGGGMDQTISILAQAGCGLQIDFSRSTTTPVPLPREYTLVIAHSLVQAPKSESAMASYNLRAAESRIAGEIFRRALERELGIPLQSSFIGHLRRYREEAGEARFDRLAATTFHEQPYSNEEVASLLATSVDGFRETFGVPHRAAERERSGAEGGGTTRRTGSPSGYKLFQRFTHVLEECMRVERLGTALKASDISSAGDLMNTSHESCRDLFEISCRELDELVGIERKAGAIGARMTGAGFGGCTVYLVENTAVDESIRDVVREYYEGFHGLRREDYSDLVFPVRAVAGVSWL